ncbi:hypothetical protein [Sulfobacillus harzensis]|uniref:Uncharacterized protein n=1 Tax=Sulfobacillus harzensis TaxID=2729629 RepID=A0A7Y0L1Y7_9FIRM|nr:hypothetical protein [Sulfobacillus harzensis]NMP21801.1 hypothetical protein [Sulfobacillus harzensis]
MIQSAESTELFGKSKQKRVRGRSSNPIADRYAALYAHLWALARVPEQPADSRAAERVLGGQFSVAATILHGAEVPESVPMRWIWQPLPDDLPSRDICYIAAALAGHLWGPDPRPPRSEVSERLAKEDIPMPPPGPVPRRILVLLGLAEPVPPPTVCRKSGSAIFDEGWVQRQGRRLESTPTKQRHGDPDRSRRNRGTAFAASRAAAFGAIQGQ